MYKTTMPITSLAGNGLQIRAHSAVTETMFPADQWAALLAEGAVVENKPATEPKAIKRRKSNA